MIRKTQKQPEKTLDQLLSGIQTWETDEFENSFLATICFLVEGDAKEFDLAALIKILTVVDESWFTQDYRKAIFYAIKKVFSGTSKTQFLLPGSLGVMATNMLKLRNKHDQCQFIDSVISAPSIFYSIESLESVLPVWRIKLVRRQMISSSEQILDIFNDQPDPDLILQKIPKLLEQQQETWNNLSFGPQKNDDWGSSVEELLSPLPEDTSISTGLKVLDEAIQGGIASRNSPYSGRLIVLAARPAMGKSTIAISLATHLADSCGDVAFFSLEMSKRQVQYKAISCYDYLNLSLSKNLTNPIRSHNLQRRTYTTDQRQ
jgi:replicative DNA helicase